MTPLPILSYAALGVASFIAGAINAVAGGGTLLTFPALLGAGLTPVIANATSTLSLVPASAAGAYGFRNELTALSRTMKLFVLPSLIGSFAGAMLMLWGGDKLLSVLVPWLILTAALLFLVQEPLSRKLASRAQEQPMDEIAAVDNLYKNLPFVLTVIFLIAVYGGYFGAGMGILTLATLGFMGFNNIHHMNGLKNILSALMNLVATVTFICAGKIDWMTALIMSAGAVLGGLWGAKIAIKIGQKRVRQIVVLIGLTVSGVIFWQQYHSY